MTLDVYIDGWVITDGNYADFIEGEVREFALEFYAPLSLAKSARSAKQLGPSSGYTYDVTAEVVLASDDICVIDFGLLAYSGSLLDLKAGNRAGDVVEGNIRLGVDPFFYFEALAQLPSVPPLIYRWHIDAIEQDTTPYMLKDGTYVPDEKHRAFAHIGATFENVSRVNDVSPAYVLHCSKLDGPPQKVLTPERRGLRPIEGEKSPYLFRPGYIRFGRNK